MTMIESWRKAICAWRGHKRGVKVITEHNDGGLAGLTVFTEHGQFMICTFCETTWEPGKRPKSLIERVRRWK